MRSLLTIIILLYSSSSFASEKSYSVTVKPSAGIVGTTSFNIHSDKSVTVLIYESVSQITESPIALDSDTSEEIVRLIEKALGELIILEDYSMLPEYKQTSAVSITQGKFTKSISTRRYSDQLKALIETVIPYFPEEYKIQLEKK
jgi:hypothetical protein